MTLPLEDPLDALAPTPHRKTDVRFRVPEFLITRDPWSHKVMGFDMDPGPDFLSGFSRQMVYLPSGRWQAEPDQMRQRFDALSASASVWLPSASLHLI